MSDGTCIPYTKAPVTWEEKEECAVSKWYKDVVRRDLGLDAEWRGDGPLQRKARVAARELMPTHKCSTMNMTRHIIGQLLKEARK